jgi:hypothetical protein
VTHNPEYILPGRRIYLLHCGRNVAASTAAQVNTVLQARIFPRAVCASHDIAALGSPPSGVNDNDSSASSLSTVKDLRRTATVGDCAPWITIVVSIFLATMIVTRAIHYAKRLTSRLRIGHTDPFWVGGGWWRTFHRETISGLCALHRVNCVGGS